MSTPSETPTPAAGQPQGTPENTSTVPAPGSAGLRVVSIADTPDDNGEYEMVLEMDDAVRDDLEAMAEARGLDLQGLVRALLDEQIDREVVQAARHVRAWIGPEAGSWPAAREDIVLTLPRSPAPDAPRLWTSAGRLITQASALLEVTVDPDAVARLVARLEASDPTRAIESAALIWALACQEDVCGAASADVGAVAGAMLLHLHGRLDPVSAPAMAREMARCTQLADLVAWMEQHCTERDMP
mgnify:CR=1 FL=1